MTNYGPKVEWKHMTVGTRIYYTGDMANVSGLGTITKQWHNQKWGYFQVNVTMDDGREMRGLHMASFQPAPGRRFWLQEDYEADRQRRIAEAAAQWSKLKRA